MERLRSGISTGVLIKEVDGHLILEQSGDTLSEVCLEIEPTRILFPLREGEILDDLDRIAVGAEYSLTYPGTASMKCVVVFQDGQNFLLGGLPSYEYTRITLTRIDEEKYSLTLKSLKHTYYLFPFDEDWRVAADQYKLALGLNGNAREVTAPRYLIQLGVKDPFGEVHIRHFEELLPLVSKVAERLGPNHILHLFGTNEAGFDRMFPDYTIDPDLGGERALREVVSLASSLGLSTSHHYNPRIADSDWIDLNPEYRTAIVHDKGEPVVELYKDHAHYVMDPNNPAWYSRCFETIHYLASLGFDYLEIDQFTYQRNFFSDAGPLALGYKKMVDDFVKLGYNFWLEGVSDVFRLSPGNFFQILIRDRPQLWDDGENRRGYPYGKSYADFFMYIWPDSEVSYQILTENKSFEQVPGRLREARAINASIYDLELGFYDANYESNLERLLTELDAHAQA